MQTLATQPESSRSLMHFYNIVAHKDVELAASLKNCTREGALGTLLDAADDGLSMSNFTVFEIEKLMNMGAKTLLPTLFYIFHRIEQALRGQPALLMLDEAWIMFQHPLFNSKIREWLKVMRKANCMVWLATQSISDAQGGIMDVIIDSCPNKFYLPNREAMSNESIKAIYARLGLNEREIELISRAVPKRQYYLKTPEGNRMLELNLGPQTLAFVGRSDKESIAAARELERSNPAGWQRDWLRLNHAV
jgi:type IV secretion system protein VirB4